MSDCEPIGADGAMAAVRAKAAAPVRFSVELARRICLRVASGEPMSTICAEAGMPARSTLFFWARDRPKFAAELAKAKAAGGRAAKGGYPSTFCAATAEAFFDRLVEGESLMAICRDPTMPSWATFYYWRRKFPEFAEMMEVAREIQAERFFALGWDIADAVTPETAHATRVKLAHLRWTAGRLAPTKYGNTRAVEPDLPPEEPLTILQRSFRLQTRADGAQRVVGSWPCPDTGLPIAEPRGPWSLPMSQEQAQQKLAEARAKGQPVLGLEDPAAAVDADEDGDEDD